MSKQTDLINIPDAITVSGSNVGIGTSSGLSGSSASTALRIGSQINIHEYDDGGNPVQMNINQNIDPNENYITTDHAARYQMRDGVHKWFSVGSGTAGTASGIGSGEKMRIDSSGNLLVGTATPAQTISTNNVLTLKAPNINNVWGVGPTSSYGNFYISNGGTGVALSAGSTSWGTVSDERFKDIIEPITGASSKVASLRAIIGKYKSDPDGVRRSFLIAQDVQAVLPEAIDVSEDADSTLAIKYTEVIPLLTAALQEALTEIASLKTRVEALEA